MKAALRFVLKNLLFGIVFGLSAALVTHWLDSKPKPVTVAFDGWHGQRMLEQSCSVLKRDSEEQSKLGAKYQAALMSLGGKLKLPCIRDAGTMNREIEDQLLTAFATNSNCQGIEIFRGFYGPKDSTQEAMEQYTKANWRLSIDPFPSSETGEIVLSNTQWTISPRSLSGDLSDIDKAASQICAIVKGQGAQ